MAVDADDRQILLYQACKRIKRIDVAQRSHVRTQGKRLIGQRGFQCDLIARLVPLEQIAMFSYQMPRDEVNHFALHIGRQCGSAIVLAELLLPDGKLRTTKVIEGAIDLKDLRVSGGVAGSKLRQSGCDVVPPVPERHVEQGLLKN